MQQPKDTMRKGKQTDKPAPAKGSSRRPAGKGKAKAKEGLLSRPLVRFEVMAESAPWERVLDEHQLYRYRPAVRTERLGHPILRVEAVQNGEHRGFIYLPARYQQLWRELIYGALYWEQSYRWLSQKTVPETDRRMHAAWQTLRANAQITHRQFLIFRRAILHDLLHLKFDDIEQEIRSFSEFGIRLYRDWLLDSFEHAKSTEPEFLALDPSKEDNLEHFSESKPLLFNFHQLFSIQKVDTVATTATCIHLKAIRGGMDPWISTPGSQNASLLASGPSTSNHMRRGAAY
jgi:hypothetical protein